LKEEISEKRESENERVREREGERNEYKSHE
jgi:hypothetical protein